MTAVAEAQVRPGGEAPAWGKLTFGTVLASEWHKIKSVKSTLWSLVALFIVTVGITALIYGLQNDMTKVDAVRNVNAAFGFGQIAAVVLGGMAITSEYSTGMIRTSLTAVPKRSWLLLAKAIVVAVVLFVVGEITAFVSFFVSKAIASGKGVTIGLGDTGVTRALLGSGLFLAGLALMTLFIGTLLRHTAGTITTAIALIFVIGGIVALIPGAFGRWIFKLMPGNAAQSIVTTQQDPTNKHHVFGPWTGFGVFCIELAVLLIAALAVLRKRDA